MRWTNVICSLSVAISIAASTTAMGAPSEGETGAGLAKQAAAPIEQATVAKGQAGNVVIPETVGEWYIECVKDEASCSQVIAKIVRNEIATIETQCGEGFKQEFLNLESGVATKYKGYLIQRIRTSDDTEFGDPVMFAEPTDQFGAWLNEQCPQDQAPGAPIEQAAGDGEAEDEVTTIISKAQSVDTEAIDWIQASDLATVEGYQMYLDLHPEGKHANLARAMMAKLSGEGATDEGAAGETEGAPKGAGEGGELTIAPGLLKGDGPVQAQLQQNARQTTAGQFVRGLDIEARGTELMQELAAADSDAAKLAAILKQIQELIENANGSISDNGQEYERTLTDEEKKDIQRDLEVLGYYTRGIDGDFGRTMQSGTRRGIKAFQRVIGYPDTGYMTEPVRTLLLAEANRLREEFEPVITEETRAAILLERTFSRDRRRQIQDSLNRSGFNAGGTDGVFGDNTRRAIRSFQRILGHDASGYLTSFEIAVLKERAPFRDPSLLKPAPQPVRDSVERRPRRPRRSGGYTWSGSDGPKQGADRYYYMWYRPSGYTYVNCYRTSRSGSRVEKVSNVQCFQAVGYHPGWYRPSGYTYSKCYLFTPAGRRISNTHNDNCAGL